MSTVQMRPTFQLETDLSTEETMKRIQNLVTVDTDPSDHPSSPTESPNFQGQFTRDHALITICENKRHFWSPWMHLEVRSADPVRHIVGRFSPHPSIWTGFIFSYLAIGVLMFFAMMFGVSQQLSKQSPWAYYVIPIGLVIALVLWFASKAGQKLAHDEMAQMKSKLEQSLRL